MSPRINAILLQPSGLLPTSSGSITKTFSSAIESLIAPLKQILLENKNKVITK